MNIIGHPLPAEYQTLDDRTLTRYIHNFLTVSGATVEGVNGRFRNLSVNFRESGTASLPISDLIRLEEGESGAQEAFRFTFVRNPWDRLLSCYRDKVVNGKAKRFQHRYYPCTPMEEMSFHEFVRFVCRIPHDLCEIHIRRQSDFFFPGELDFVGRVENFAEDMNEVAVRSGLDRRLLQLPERKLNPSRKSAQHYVDFYNTETRKLVARKYAEDIERFSYRFGD